MKFDNYSCEGQMNLWDLFKPKPCELKADDTVCEGCKWRNNKNRELEVDEYGQTWVYRCPGTACTNWRNGTPLNLSFKSEIEESEKMYCYNRDFLPDLDVVVYLVETDTDCKFKEYTDFRGKRVFKYRYKKVDIEISESAYNYEGAEGVRFISVDWSTTTEGSACPCDNMYQVFNRVEKAFKRAGEIAKEKTK